MDYTKYFIQYLATNYVYIYICNREFKTYLEMWSIGKDKAFKIAFNRLSHYRYLFLYLSLYISLKIYWRYLNLINLHILTICTYIIICHKVLILLKNPTWISIKYNSIELKQMLLIPSRRYLCTCQAHLTLLDCLSYIVCIFMP